MRVTTKRPIVNGVVSRINRVGIELEGGWFKLPDPCPLNKEGRHEPEGDGSVRFSGSEIGNVKQFWKGEIVTPGNGLTIDEVAEWVTKHHPQKVNASCGMHVHMSFFRKLHYQQLMTPEYTTAMVAALKQFVVEEGLPEKHPLIARLNNPNHDHCAQIYCGDQQASIRKKDYNSRGKPWSRYTAINYCMGQHGTIECRLLSAFDTAEQSIRAIMKVVNTTNSFLSKVRSKETPVGGTVRSSGEMTQQFHASIY